MEERTRHRAVGAVVLLLVAAVAFPLLLRSSPPGERTPASPDPSAPSEESPDRIRITSFGGDEDTLIPSDGEVADSSHPPIETDSDQPGDTAPAAGWAVQIGSFANPDNAAKLEEQVAARGYRVLTERVTVANGKTRVRVLVGPDRTRAAAAAQRARLSREDSIEGFLVRFPG